MKRCKNFRFLCLVMVLCLGWIGSAAGAKMVQKIIMFQEKMGWGQIEEIAAQWEKDGIPTVMKLPLINGLVVKVPSNICVSDLVDLDVTGIEEDQNMELKNTVSAQYANFIRKTSQPEEKHYGWGILKLFNQSYDPESVLDWYDKDNLPDSISAAFKNLKKSKIRIAVFDTGVQDLHYNLFKEISGGLDLIDTINDGENRIGITGAPIDNNGHGTHVTGIIAAVLDRNGHWGKNPSVELYSVKILDERGLGDLSSIIMGLQWAIDNDIDIVNMSIAFRQDSPSIRRAVHEAYNAGLIMLASVGNHSNWDDTVTLASDGGSSDGGSSDGGSSDGGSSDGGSSDGGSSDGGSAIAYLNEFFGVYPVMYPARYPEVIAIGASDAYGKTASFSNQGMETDLLAPGNNIISAVGDEGNPLSWIVTYDSLGVPHYYINDYGICSGTSQAVPHVTAAVALMLALDNNLGPDEIKKIIVETSTFTELGSAGEINLTAALDKIRAKKLSLVKIKKNTLKYRDKLKDKIHDIKGSLWLNPNEAIDLNDQANVTDKKK